MQTNQNELWCTIVISTASKDISPEVLESLFPEVRRYRAADNITGISVYSNGNALMLFEGAKEIVLQEYERTKKHNTHHSLIKLYNGSIPCRFFEGQPLAFKVLSPGTFKYLDTFQSDEAKEYLDEFLNTNHPACTIVSNFIKNNT